MPQKHPKKSSGKSLQTLYYADEPFYGKSDICTGEIRVNIQLLWQLSKKKENDFIKLFSMTYTHEIVHTLINAIFSELYSCGEEKVIRTLLQEGWDKGVEEYYLCKKKEEPR
jgi:hypothetical protein